MAIDTGIHSPHEFQFAIAEESTFGTANTTQGEFYRLHTTEHPQYDFSGLVIDETKRADGRNVWSSGERFSTKKGAVFTSTVSGVVTRQTIAYLLYGVLQDLSAETDSGNYSKTFSWDRGTSIGLTPNKFYSVLFYDPETNTHKQMRSAIIKTLVLSIDPTTNGGRLSFQATFWSGRVGSYGLGLTATPSSWNAADTDYYTLGDLTTKTIDSNDALVESFSMTMENNAARIGHENSAGGAEGYAICKGQTPGDVALEVKAKYDANTAQLYENILSNGNSADLPVELSFTGSVSDELRLVFNGWLTNSVPDMGGDAGVMSNLTFKGCDDGTNSVLVAITQDGVNRNWLA